MSDIRRILSRVVGKSARPSDTAHRGEAGFTLVELLVVLVILVLLASLVGPRVIGYLSSSKTKTAKVQIENLATALELYKLDVGSYPGSNEGLRALVEAPANVASWSGPYLNKQQVPNDPWGNPYRYQSPGQNGGDFDLYSLGRDNKQGGDDEDADISNR